MIDHEVVVFAVAVERRDCEQVPSGSGSGWFYAYFLCSVIAGQGCKPER